MVSIYTGNLCDTFFLCRHNASVTCEYVVILINDNRIYKAEFTQRGTKFQNLFLVMGAGIIGVGNELVDIHKLKFCGCGH